MDSAKTRPAAKRIDRTKPASCDQSQPVILRVAIKRAGKIVRTVEFNDPRVRFCQTFNEDSSIDGLTAELVG